MKLLAATTAMGLLIALGAVAPATADTDAVELETAPVWAASVASLADDGGLALVQDEDEECDDEDEEDDEDDADDEEDDEDDADEDEDDGDDEEDEDDECEDEDE